MKSVLIGALTAAAPFMIFTAFLAVGLYSHESGLPTALWILLLPLAVTVPIVLVAALLIGLPATVLLRRAGRESGTAYLLCGGLSGAFLSILLARFLGEPTGAWLGPLGAIAGGATGWTWWRDARESIVLAALADG